jgi:hypothetical protein
MSDEDEGVADLGGGVGVDQGPEPSEELEDDHGGEAGPTG